MSASNTTLHVMSGGAPKEVFALLTPQFEQRTGHQVRFTYAVITALRDRIAAGERTDVLVLPAPVLDALAKEGKVRADARAVFGTVGIIVVTRRGVRPPDISTKEKFRDAMLAARAVVHATPGQTPSGTHMGKVMADLGIAGEIAKKVIHKPALDGGVQLVVAGEADIGMYPASEVAGVDGLTVVGSLPPRLDLAIVFGAAVSADSVLADAAAAFVQFMAAAENRAVWKNAGFAPPAS